MNKVIDSDKLQGVIRNPFAFYFLIQRGYSGPIQTLPTVMEIGLLFPLNGTWWFVRNIVDDPIHGTLDCIGNSSADLLKDTVRYF